MIRMSDFHQQESSVTKNQFVKYLKDHGFRLVRNGTHAYYSDGASKVTVSHGSKVNPECIHHARLAIKKQGRRRQIAS
jgi:predicted RNA binding protein YcfA (HicA-like mRNA interferase family)